MMDTEEAVHGPSMQGHHLQPRALEQAAYDQGSTARYSGTPFWLNPHRREAELPDPLMAAFWNQGWIERDSAIRALLCK